ncbi:hypothetical protein ABDK56_11950 [Sphingomonas sp. ASV193]|uniref:YncE family protein n=1 Tax=Sphingomonas sp. ASV193 TaxID=3144405 RepID=UPI0032E87729
MRVKRASISSWLICIAASIIASSTAEAAPRIVDRIPLADGGWDILTVQPETGLVFISRSDGVDRVDPRRRTVVHQFVHGDHFHGVATIPGGTLALATERAGEGLLFDTQSGAIKARIKLDPDADAIAYDPSDKAFWAANGDSGTIAEIDSTNGRLLGNVNVGGSLEFMTLDGAGHLFVNVADKSELVEVDTASRKIVRREHLVGCEHPTGIAPVGDGLLLSACANGIARLSRSSSLVRAGDLVIGPRPDGAFADPSRRRAYVPSGGDGSLSIIDTTRPAPKVLAKLLTEVGGRTGAVDPSSGRVYIVAAKFGAPSSPNSRPAVVPGTVELLVVDPEVRPANSTVAP